MNQKLKRKFGKACPVQTGWLHINHTSKVVSVTETRVFSVINYLNKIMIHRNKNIHKAPGWLTKFRFANFLWFSIKWKTNESQDFACKIIMFHKYLRTARIQTKKTQPIPKHTQTHSNNTHTHMLYATECLAWRQIWVILCVAFSSAP